MENIYNRKEIADGVFFTAITDDKFKVSKIGLYFTSQLSDDAAVNAVVSHVLINCNNKYNTMAKLNRRLSELYSADTTVDTFTGGDTQFCQLGISVISNKFALEGEDILRECAGILYDCIFDPYLEDGQFPLSSLEIEKQNQIDANNSEINDKGYYSYYKAYTAAFKGEPAEIRHSGSNEQISAVTQETAMQAYKRFLTDTRVEIICAGESDFSGIDEIFAEGFKKAGRNSAPKSQTQLSPLKPQPVRITENMDIEQSKLVLFFKTSYRNRSAMRVMNALFGATESSKLFTIVREQMSLCYYCYTRLLYAKGAVSLECGVNKSDLEKAEKECLNQLEEIKKGNFTDDDIKKNKLAIINDIRSAGDSVSGVISRVITGIHYGGEYAVTPQEAEESVSAVTREDIIKAAQSLSVDTVFVLTPDNAAGGNDE